MNKEISFNQIPDLNYQGYYWLSNAQTPIILRHEKINLQLFEKALPFIIEGNFYHKEEEISINVKFIDGDYKICQYNLKDYPRKEYLCIGHLIEKGFPIYEMVEAWEEVINNESSEVDSLAGMVSLQPAWSAFAGFKNA